MTRKEERIMLIGYLLGTVAREANINGVDRIDSEDISKLLGLFREEPILTDEENTLLEFVESKVFQFNLESGTNRRTRRQKLKSNKKVYR